MAGNHSAWLGTLGLLIETNLGSRAWIRVGGRLVRGSDQYRQSGQTSVQRDMDPQYATVDQLAEITDTMASLKDVILRLDDTQTRIERIEQRVRSLHVTNGVMSWDGYDQLPVAALPIEFGHVRRDIDDHVVPSILSGAAQRWFASLDPSRRRTWTDLAQEFLRQYSFNIVVDVSRRELEALKQRPDETVTSFISRWREKIALYGIEEGISRGLWAGSSPSDSKKKKPWSGPRPSDVGTIGMMGHRSSRRPQTQRQLSDTFYKMIQHDQYKPAIPIRPAGPAYLHPSP
ncbi:hypothetical protein CK203_058764 [Vitis vinifera]|uniref:Retrotransposon gag domain-containing protein n=1 Tax=Vitis vinifera TaxID=29760 RepID=A0A438FTJ7_VITVI|nr:hypothetical protein CK203_058764 [Vitis vinifera]